MPSCFAPALSRRASASALLLFASLGSLLSCRDTSAPAGVRVVNIVGGPAFIREIGDTMRLRAIAMSADSTVLDVHVAWASSDSSIVSVSTDGLLTARHVGGAEITASVDGVKARYPVSVAEIVALMLSHEVDVAVGETATLSASVRYSDGPAAWSHPATWTVRDTSLIDVDSAGRVHGRSRAGTTFVLGTIKGFVDSTVVVVRNPAFYVWPDTNVVPLGTTRPLRVEQFIASNGVIAAVSGATWSSSDPTVATVDASGVVTPRQTGHATIAADRNGQHAVAEVFVRAYDHPFRFTSVAALGLGGTCALESGRAYCWGDLREMLDASPMADRCEAVSTGTKSIEYYRTVSRCVGSPVPAFAALSFASLVDAGLALTADGTLYGLSTSGAASLAPGYRFREATRQSQICAVGLDDTGYCWGDNWSGLLGIGTARDLGPYPSSPQPIAGNIKWSHLDAGLYATCGLATDGQAYCWGWNARFRLGVGADSTVRPGCSDACVVVPTAVRTTATFTMLATRGGDSCASTSGGQTYCWGELPPTLPRSAAGIPVLVASAPVFVSLSGAAGQLCGITGDGSVYCLERNAAATDAGSLYSFGRLPLPFAVRSISFGVSSSCAIAAGDGRLYCWERGVGGGLGDGRFADATPSAPVLVAGQ